MRKLLAAVILVAGCGTAIQTTVINPAPHATQARPPETVQVFTSGPPQNRQFVDVAYLEAEQESQLSGDNTPEFLGKLREHAARMGCDAIVVGNVTHEAISGVDRRTSSLKGIVATCIMFTDADGQIAARP